MTHEEIEAIAERASEATIRRWFLTLGIPTDEGVHVVDLQKDFAFIRSQRQSAEAFKSNAKRTGWYVLGVGIVGFVSWLLATFHLPPAGPTH